jgi:hypothetical protein
MKSVLLFYGVYGIRKVQMPLPGCCVSAGTLVRNYGATKMVPTQKRPTPPLIEEVTAFTNT